MVSVIRCAVVALLCAVASATRDAHVSDSQLFRCEQVQDLGARGRTVHHVNKRSECALRCFKKDTCRGFSYKPHAYCKLYFPATSWQETKLHHPIEVCFKNFGAWKKCSAYKFPYANGRSRYAFVRQKLNWTDAATSCEKMGSKLTQISTHSEQAFVRQILAKEHAEHFTTGGHVQMPGSTEPAEGWVWHRSGDMVDDQFWYHGEPNDYKGRQDFGSFYRNAKLDDATNGAKFYYLCECLLI